MKRRSFGLKADAIKDDDLYLHLEKIIMKHGSYRAAVEDLLVRDKEDQLGKELSKVKRKIVQDVTGEMKKEISTLKTYIDDQLATRTFAENERTKTDESSIENVLEDSHEDQVYDIEELEVVGNIEEEYDFDF